MKAILLRSLATVAMLVWLWPLLAGLTDIACWMARAHTCTGMPWDPVRGFLAVMWLIFIALAAVPVVCACLEEADR